MSTDAGASPTRGALSLSLAVAAATVAVATAAAATPAISAPPVTTIPAAQTPFVTQPGTTFQPSTSAQPGATSQSAPPDLQPIQPPSPDDLLFAAPTRLDRIGRVVVAVTINGQGPFRFIVDTGANYSTVSPNLVSKLGVQPTAAAAMLVNGITGTAQVPTVPIQKLQAGDLVIENKQLPVVWAPLMAGADGILGVAGLTDERLLVDFAQNRVTLAHAHHNPDPHGFARIPARRIHGGLISVAAKVGGVPVQAVIDTGSERTIANSALRDALYRRSRQEKLQNTNVYGATTDVVSGQMEQSPTIDLGSVHIGSVTLVFGDFHIFDVWGMTQRPAMIVGMDVLGTVGALNIDFQRAEIFIDSDLHSAAVTIRPY